MSPRKLIVVISIWFLIGSFSFDIARAETLDRIVAVVNSEIILYGDLQEQMSRLEKVSGNPPIQDPAMRAKVEREVLDSMIRQRLTEQEAKRLKINVSNSELDLAIEAIKREHGFTDAQLQYMNSQEGQTMAQFRERIRSRAATRQAYREGHQIENRHHRRASQCQPAIRQREQPFHRASAAGSDFSTHSGKGRHRDCRGG